MLKDVTVELKFCLLYTSAVSKAGINIDNMLNRSRGDYAYTILDTAAETIGDDIVENISGISCVIRVRVIQ